MYLSIACAIILMLRNDQLQDKDDSMTFQLPGLPQIDSNEALASMHEVMVYESPRAAHTLANALSSAYTHCTSRYIYDANGNRLDCFNLTHLIYHVTRSCIVVQYPSSFPSTSITSSQILSHGSQTINLSDSSFKWHINNHDDYGSQSQPEYIYPDQIMDEPTQYMNSMTEGQTIALSVLLLLIMYSFHFVHCESSIKILIYSVIFCVASAVDIRFGFTTGSDRYDASGSPATLSFYWGNLMYECVVTPSILDTLYTCESTHASTKQCISSYQTKYGLQLSNPTANDFKVENIVIAIGDTWKTANVLDEMVGDNGYYHRYYDLNGPTLNDVPSPVSSIQGMSVPDCDTRLPSASPTEARSESPSQSPSAIPTEFPTVSPIKFPTANPTKSPSASPSRSPSAIPTEFPTATPIKSPSSSPSTRPTSPTMNPLSPTYVPTIHPTVTPSMYPSTNPTEHPSVSPSIHPYTNPLNYDEKEAELDALRVMYQWTAGGFVVFCLLICMTGYIDSRWIRTNDYFEYLSIGTMMLATLDMVSDCFFAVEVSIREMRIIFYGSVLFIGLPSLVALFQLHFHTTKYWLDGGRVTPWIQKYIAVLLLVSIVTGNAFAAVSLMNSGLYHMDVFYMGLTKYQLQTFNIQKMYSIVFLEDVPQLCLQSYYLWISEDVHNPIAISSIILSMVSIIVSAMHLSIEKQINYQQKYVIVKLHITGEYVEQKLSNCKTLSHDLKRGLGKYLNKDAKRIEIIKPTDINHGVKVRIIITKNGRNQRQNDNDEKDKTDEKFDHDDDEKYEALDEDGVTEDAPLTTQERSQYVDIFEDQEAADVFEENWKLSKLEMSIDAKATLVVRVQTIVQISNIQKGYCTI
eukprot:106354_1